MTHCRYGSPHLKSFRFLCVNIKLHHASPRCKCKGPHLQVQRRYVKASATSTDALAEALAAGFAVALKQRLAREVCEEADYPPTRGLENQLVNEVVFTSGWKEKASWKFRRQLHINLLELKSILRRVSELVKEKKQMRFCALGSIVARGPVSKGRSASLAVSSMLRNICSLMIAGGLFAATPFVPTYHNSADDPTRHGPLRSPISGSSIGRWSREDIIIMLAKLPGLRRWISNRARLIIVLSSPNVLWILHRNIWRSSSKIFDSTLGFPGEGLPGFAFCCPAELRL